MDQSSNQINFENQFNDEEIDLRIIFNFLNRNKIFLGKLCFIFLILGSLFSFLPKKTWEGQFQIVLNLEGNETNSLLSSRILNIVRPSGTSNNLKTEVGILESPLVLMPVYEFMLSRNNNITEKNFSFSDWKQNLSIKLEKETSILNISYRDKNRDLILPILENMSTSYQKYSGRAKRRLLENSNNYLKNQIEIYKSKSAISLKSAQEFAIDQDLMYFDQTIPQSPSLTNSSDLFSEINPIPISLEETPFPLPEVLQKTSPLLLGNIDVENIRVQAANEIRRIDLQLEKISEIDNSKDFQYTGVTIPALVETGLPQNLQIIETQLVELRSKYTEEDSSIKRLLEKRKLTIDLLKERSINYLKAKRLEAESKMEAASRPKGILLKYKELIRNAERDEDTLINLENQLTVNELEKSRQKDPWQLITKPTLLRYPVSPKKSNIAFLSVLIALLFGIIFSIYKEKKSGKIYELKNLLQIIRFKFIEIIKLSDTSLNRDQFVFIKEFIKSQSKDKINLILLGEIKEEEVKTFKEILLKQFNKKLIITSNLQNINENAKGSTNLILSSLGCVTLSQLKILKNCQELMDINLLCLILLEK